MMPIYVVKEDKHLKYCPLLFILFIQAVLMHIILSRKSIAEFNRANFN